MLKKSETNGKDKGTREVSRVVLVGVSWCELERRCLGIEDPMGSSERGGTIRSENEPKNSWIGGERTFRGIYSSK